MYKIIKYRLLVIMATISIAFAHNHHVVAYENLSHKDLVALLKDKQEEVNNLRWKLRAAKLGWGMLGLMAGCTGMAIKHHLDNVK